MRVLIVDDEPLARNALANAISGRKDIEQFDSAHDALEALEMLGSTAYDVMLLDIDMPELSGIELLERLEKRGRPLPSVVFVTAHHEHAVAAFEKHATDYVLKPFSSERIFEALDEASRRTAGERAAKLIEILPHLQMSSRQAPTRIAIKAKGRILFIEPKDVTVVEAEGNYVLLQRRSGSYLLRESISTVAEKLKPYGFIRIHRSVLVNSAYVEEIQPWFTGEYTLRVTGGKEYMVSRTYKKNLKALADYWLGTDTFVGD